MRQVITIVTCAFASVASGQVIQGPVTNPANGHEYYLLQNSNWTQAEAWAVGLGGHLATINDEAENEWVFTTFSSPVGQPPNLWIGLNDAAVEGEYVWVSGEASTMEPLFADGEPNDDINVADEDYVHMRHNEGEWNDHDDTLFRGGNPSFPIFGIAEVIPALCTGDADGDDDVDFEDLNTVLAAWNTSGPEGDVNDSGFVDFDDLNEVLNDWGCPD